MNKVSIVGHPACGLQQVEILLRQCGMQPPLPSRRDGMTPHDIARALIKAHQCEPVDVATDEATLSPIEVGPVWHGMALDLLLGNLDQPFWGWADPNTIYLLDYWRMLDPQIVFVLVYDQPRSSLRKWAEDQDCTENATDLRKPLDNWSAYNGALLRFYLRHPERCVLVSVDQVHHMLDAYLQQMGQKLRPPLTLSELRFDPQSFGVPSLPAPLQATAHILGAASTDVATLWQVPQVEDYLIDEVLGRYPEATQLYQELQSAGSLPPNPRINGETDAAPAWQAYLRHRSTVARTLAHMVEIHERTAAQARDFLAQLKAVENTRLLEQREYEKIKGLVAKSDQEKSDLLLQLQLVQEELERQCAAKTSLSTQVDDLQSQNRVLLQAKEELLEIRKKLEEELKDAAGQIVVTTENKDENELLLNQLHEVQEELERYYHENQRLKAAANAKPAKPRYYGAADRIKQQLTYRLGARVILQNQTFWGKVLLLPALWHEARAFKHDQANRIEKKFPPLNQYADAHEAERVKQHLSYRLGLVVRQVGYNPFKWPILPFALKSATKLWKREQQRL